MRPEDNRPTSPLVIPSRQIVGTSLPTRPSGNNAAADVVRSQIDTIYRQDPNLTTTVSQDDTNVTPPARNVESHTQPASSVSPGPGAVNMQATHQQKTVENPYEQTQQAQHTVQSNEWQKYHSAWQSYYQQYYERYYVGQVQEAKKSLAASIPSRKTDEPDETISANEAMYDIRSRLRNRINQRATQVRKSRHFMPALAAAMVMLIFLFLQYNRILFANVSAYITPGQLDPSTLIIDPNTNVTVSADPRLVIPKISVDVPIVWDADASSLASLNAAMDKGVAWFNIQGASAKPGEKGNFVLSGHSSNDWVDRGDYKFIFAPLERMKEGDTIYVNYESKRYAYTVTSTKIVKPTDVAALHIGVDKPRITLITCTPLGTDLNRLLVFADQVSPDPNEATTAQSEVASSTTTSKMPSNSPTFLERIFGIRKD